MAKWSRPRFTPNLPLGAGGERVTASPAHIEISKNAAKEGMVLLKNEDSVLPLKRGTRIALFGKGTFDYVKGGGGSGDVTVAYIRNLYEGFKALGDRVLVYDRTADFYSSYVSEQYAKGSMPGMIREPELPDELVAGAAAFTDTAVISISRFSGEGWDRKSSVGKAGEHECDNNEIVRLADTIFDSGDFYLTLAEKAMVDKVAGAFKKVVVVLNVGGMVDSEWFKEDERINSVLMAWQGGMEGGLAAAELLTGIGTPSGKLADTFAKRLEDYPSTATFHESGDYVKYYEDIYVGYRYFETIPGAAEKVNYPFGYGLSYTSFKISDAAVTEKVCKKCGRKRFIFEVTVTNTGSCTGKEVVQLYYGAPQGLLGKPAKVLAGYRKTRLLQPGESELVTLKLKAEDMASYDDLGKVCKSAYVLEKGDYHFYLGTDVRSAADTGFVWQNDEDIVTLQLTEKMAPTSLEKRLCSDGTYEELPTGEPFDTDACAIKHMTKQESEGNIPQTRFHDYTTAPWHADPNAPTVPKLIDVAEGKITLKDFIAQLPDEDLFWLLSGTPNTGVANTFGIGNIPDYGIPNVMTADGPAGVRVAKETGVVTTAFPCSTLLACTWNEDVVYEVGEAGGKELKENNLCVWLTPAVNIHRSPLCGRNFEYYSEDPYLAGKQAAAMVKGIQSNNVGTSLKHFALNDKETNRKDSDSRASERAIREIYLKQFEIVVKEADPWSIMTSYNIINGHRASENSDLLRGILRGEWGYTGMVTTDWWTYGEHYKEAMAGNDLKMGCGYPERLKMAKEAGALTREAMEEAAEHILGLILKLD